MAKPKKEYAFTDLAEEVLKNAQQPLTTSEIWKKATELGLDKKLDTKSVDIVCSLNSNLCQDVKKDTTVFFKLPNQPTRWGLKEDRDSFMKRTDELKKSPIFALSKCNNELAHSNFWAWLMEYDDQGKHPFAGLFIRDFDEDTIFDDVKREEKNRDLTIYYHRKGESKERRICIVENKLKSIPTEQQLLRYEKEIKEQYEDENNKDEKRIFKGGTLTGIEETLDRSELENWSFVSYEELAQEIKRIVDEGKVSVERDKQVIRQYIKDITNVSSVLKIALRTLGDHWLLSDGEMLNRLEEVKLKDVFLKHVGCLLKSQIDEKISQEQGSLKTKWDIPKVDVSFFNKSSVVTIIYKKVDREKVNKKGEHPELWRLGVQIQGRQFRIYGGPGKSINEEETNNLFDELQGCGWFEEKCDGKIRGRHTSMNGGRGETGTLQYCKYKTNQYTHIYQYRDIEEKETREELAELVISELANAKEIIDNNRIDFRRYCG